MSIFLDKDSVVIVQGITGGEGSKHTCVDVGGRHQCRRWG
jgi:succinyl-CoA synthetase alpha subunit